MASFQKKLHTAVGIAVACAMAVSNTVLVFAATKTAAVPAATKTAAPVPPPVPTHMYTLESLPENTVYSDFVVGPGKVELDLEPGESRTIELTLSNRMGTEKTFSVSEEDLKGSDDPKQVVVLLGDDRGPYSLKDFLHLSDSEVIVPHGDKARIPVTISIPATAQPGGYYGSVVISTISRTNSATSVSGSTATNPIVARIGTIFLIRVKGQVTEDGRLTGFRLAGNTSLVTDTGPLIFDLYFENKGNVHLDPYGDITVSNMLGATVGSITADPWFALPNSLRFREVEWKTPFLFGRYVAHASIHRGYGTETDQATYTFWVIPWKIIAAIIIGIILLVTLIRFITTRFSISRKR